MFSEADPGFSYEATAVIHKETGVVEITTRLGTPGGLSIKESKVRLIEMDQFTLRRQKCMITMSQKVK